MKARIKSTGDIMPIAPYAKVTLDVCDDRGTPYEVDFEDIELVSDEDATCDTDWDAFHREATKDLLPFVAALCDYRGGREAFVKESIRLANELIQQLKEEEQ